MNSKFPIITKIIELTSRHNKIYNKFLVSTLAIRKKINIFENLNIIYECLLKEQMEMNSFKCMERYFQENIHENLLNLSKIDIENKQNIFDFFEKIYKIIPKELQINSIIVKNNISLFNMKDPSSLPYALVICNDLLEHKERVEFYINGDSALLSYISEYLFNNGTQGEISQTCMNYLLSVEKRNIIDCVIIKGFHDKYIDRLNDYFLLITRKYNIDDSVFYNNLLSLAILMQRRMKKYDIHSNIVEAINIDVKNRESKVLFMYWSDIMQQQNQTEHIQVFIDKFYMSEAVNSHLIDAVCRDEALKFLKNSLKYHPMYTISFFIDCNDMKECKKSNFILQGIRNIILKYPEYKPDIIRMKSLTSLTSTECSSSSLYNYERKKKTEIFDLLLNNFIYDYEIYFRLFFNHKKLLFIYYDKLHSVLKHSNQEYQLLDFLYIFNY